MVDGKFYPPTPEQQKALDAFATGDDLRIAAGAGTGKTTTLAMCARSTPRIGTYLAFNTEIARDAAMAMPQTVSCRTVHSIAARLVRNMHPEGEALLDRLGADRMSPWQVAKHLGLGALIVSIPIDPERPNEFRQKVIQPNYQASHVLRAAAAFCNSDDPEPDTQHFPYIDGIDPMVRGRRTYVNNNQVAKALLPALQRAWRDLTTGTGRLRFFHDVYLKLAALDRYPIPGQYLLFDEAQDASPVMLGWLARQEGGKQVVYVGDSNQQIYEWRGAVDALALLGDIPTAYLTQSWRFGPAVADVANLVLDRLDGDLRLSGTPSIPSVVHRAVGLRRPRAVLCRSNAEAIRQVLMFQERGMAPHLVGGSKELVWFAEAAGRLQAGQPAKHPELSCFDNWREVQQYVEDDPGGSDLRMMVNLIDSYGPEIVVEALSGLLAQEEADVVVSTAHKAKGREWESVRLAPDFETADGSDLAPSEWRLLYVAATRATHHLDVSACLPVRELLDA